MKNRRLIFTVIGVVVALAAVIAAVVIVVTKTNKPAEPQPVIAATYGDITITQEEYSYGYMSLYNQVLQVVKQYDEYYPGYGAQYYDTTLSPADQPCPADSLPEGVETWGDYFAHYAVERAVLIKVLYTKAMSQEAKDMGFEITPEQQTEMDENVKTFMDALQAKADKQGVSIDEYISTTYGYSLSKAVYEEQLKREYISELYLLWYSEYLEDEISQEDIDAYYLQNKDDIDIVSIRAFTFSYASTSQSAIPTYTKEEAEAKANSFLAELSDEQSFIDAAVKYAPAEHSSEYGTYSATLLPNYTKAQFSSISAELSEWLFDDARAVNDKIVIDLVEQQAYCVVMLPQLPHKDTACSSADVRHLLVEYGDDKNASRREAEDLLASWKDGGATEEQFIELVKLHTDDVASAESGGLYSGITSASQYVPEFLAWAIAPHEYGDAKIVETTYGYHIMFYVGGDATQKWESDIRIALSQIKYSDFYDELYKDIEENTVKEQTVINTVNVENLKMIIEYQKMLNGEAITTTVKQ